MKDVYFSLYSRLFEYLYFQERVLMAEVKKDLRKIERECAELDKLEARLRRLVSPDEKLLAQIAQRRNELLKS